MGKEEVNFDDFDLSALPIVLGDCLTVPELRDVVFWLHEGVDRAVAFSDSETTNGDCGLR
jgi:hypothetical protein